MDNPTFKIITLTRRKNASGAVLYLPARYLEKAGITPNEGSICIMMHKDRIVISSTKKGFLENLAKSTEQLDQEFEIIDEKIAKTFGKILGRKI